MAKVIYNTSTGLYQALGRGIEITGDDEGSMSIKRNVAIETSPEAGVSEISGSLLQLKGRAEGIHFHVGGHQYISSNAWYDASDATW